MLLDVALVSLKELKLHADDLRLNLHSIIVKFVLKLNQRRIQCALIKTAILYVRQCLVSLEVLSLANFDKVVDVFLVSDVANDLQHLASELTVKPYVRVDFIQVVHVVITDILNFQL